MLCQLNNRALLGLAFPLGMDFALGLSLGFGSELGSELGQCNCRRRGVKGLARVNVIVVVVAKGLRTWRR
jgi:hypothetical protein